MNTVTIVRRICLPSRYLDSNIMSHLLREVSETTNQECSKNYGYILSVKGINKIVNHKIGRANADNVFTVEFEAVTLHPKPGMKVQGTACMIYKDGIFVNSMDKQKMLIASTSMIIDENSGFDDITGTYNISGRTIKVGDKIMVEVTASQYSNGFFSCIGTLKDV